MSPFPSIHTLWGPLAKKILPLKASLFFLIAGFLTLLFLLGFYSHGMSQPDASASFGGLTVTAKGTGRTTGHIATLSLHNPTSRDILIDVGPFFIPSTGKYQSYIVPEVIEVGLPPGEAITLPIEGFCTDVRRPPVPLGDAMPPLDSWVIPIDFPDVWTPATASGWRPAKDQSLTIPGKEESLGYTLDIDKYPQEGGMVLLDASRRIIESTDDLQENDLLNTPFSTNDLRERESVIQQTIWIYASRLTGESYSREDFAEQTNKQFEETSGRRVTSLSSKEKEQLTTGIDDFWNTFEAVGVSAKIMKDAPQNPVLIQMRTVRPQCTCDSIYVEVDIYDGSRLVDSGAYQTNKVGTTKNNEIQLSDVTVKSGDSLKVKISGINIICSCDPDLMCIPHPRRNIGGPDLENPGKYDILLGENDDDASNDNFHCIRKEATDNGWNAAKDSFTLSLQFNRFGRRIDNPFQCFTVRSICHNDTCRDKLCKQRVCIRFTWAKD